MKVLLSICRVVIGTLFIVSGLIKANDPYGFTFKLEEYFSVFIEDLTTKKVEIQDAENIADGPCAEKLKPEPKTKTTTIPKEDRSFVTNSLVGLFGLFAGKENESTTLLLSVFICVLEIVLGVFVIIGYRMNLATWLLLLMIIFFTFLTFYSAYFEKVKDCGCFGDALKLTPWESFGKDIFLLIFILPLFIWRKKINGMQLNTSEWMISVASLISMLLLCVLIFDWLFPVWFTLILLLIRFATQKVSKPVFRLFINLAVITGFSVAFPLYCIAHNPVKDYRPWAVGSKIIPQTSGTPEFSKMRFYYLKKSDCSVVEISEDELSQIDSAFNANHKFWKTEKKIIKKAIPPKVKDFTLNSAQTGISIADSVLQHEGYTLLLVARDLEKSATKNMDKINTLAAYSRKNGIWFVGATATAINLEQLKAKYNNTFTYYLNDATALKTIIRSNPGLILLHGDRVIGKWHWRDIPSVEVLKDLVE